MTKDFSADQVRRHAGVDPASLEFRLAGATLRRLVSFSPYVLTEFQSLENPTMQDTVAYIKNMLDPVSHTAFEEAMERGEPRPTMDTLMEMINWLVEQATSRPTSASSPSSAGRNGTGTLSTEDSSSLVAPI